LVSLPFVALPFSRLEGIGRIKAEWRATENNRRAKYYLLTESGRKALKDETREWGRQTAAIARFSKPVDSAALCGGGACITVTVTKCDQAGRALVYS
jgi:DNA-binding MarR family transcriptional regulator